MPTVTSTLGAVYVHRRDHQQPITSAMIARSAHGLAGSSEAPHRPWRGSPPLVGRVSGRRVRLVARGCVAAD